MSYTKNTNNLSSNHVTNFFFFFVELKMKVLFVSSLESPEVHVDCLTYFVQKLTKPELYLFHFVFYWFCFWIMKIRENYKVLTVSDKVRVTDLVVVSSGQLIFSGIDLNYVQWRYLLNIM